MGIDLVGWRDCGLQRELGRDGFLRMLKLNAYRRRLEAHFEAHETPEAERPGQQLRVAVEGREPEVLTYAAIRDATERFAAGVPACATCPLARGRAVGCYRYVTYPLDAAFEEHLFAFFERDVLRSGSPSSELYGAIAAQLDAEAAERWAQGVVERERPLTLAIDDTAVTSRQVLAALLAVDHSREGTLSLASRFLSAFVDDLLFGAVGASQTEMTASAVEITLEGDALLGALRSDTLREVSEMARLFEAADREGWTVLWDG